MTTALELITGAARLIGVVASGEPLQASEANDCLDALNEMLDAWSTSELNVYAIQEQSLTWPANTQTITAGPTGDVVIERPIKILDGSFLTVSSVKYPVNIIGYEAFYALNASEITGSTPDFIYPNYTMPNVTLSAFPSPTQEFTLTLLSRLPLTQPATLVTDLTMPPGYKKAFRFNLAVAIAPEFGIQAPPTVAQNAGIALRELNRSNYKADDHRMRLPGDLPGAIKSDIISGSVTYTGAGSDLSW